jgi:hypothetical protein
MREEMREMLGKAAHAAEAQHIEYLLPWEDLLETGRETYRIQAQGVAEVLAIMIMQLMREIFTKEQIEEILETL